MLRDLMQRHGLHPDKRLGQHFLLDGNVTEKIVRLCGNLAGLHVVEVGPGPGGLTASILGANPASVTAIEKDPRCISLLTERFGQDPRLRLIEGDALKISLPEQTRAPRAIIANLPYNVGTEMLIRWLTETGMRRQASGTGAVLKGSARHETLPPEQGEARERGGSEALGGVPPYRFMTLMFQKEVVDRLAAKPGTKDYGRLSVITQWLCEVEPLFDLPPSAFIPPPKVTSTVVRLVPRAQPEPCNLRVLEKLTASAFGQRRKMLRASLKSLGGESLLEKAGIEPTLRAENLTVGEFIRIANLQPSANSP